LNGATLAGRAWKWKPEAQAKIQRRNLFLRLRFRLQTIAEVALSG